MHMAHSVVAFVTFSELNADEATIKCSMQLIPTIHEFPCSGVIIDVC